ILASINTRTGAVSRFSRPGNTFGWLVDTNDVPRVAETSDGDKSAVHLMDPATKQWRQLLEFNRFTRSGAFDPVAITPDGSMYVTSARGGGPEALYRFDFAKNAPEPEPLISLKGFDFSGIFISDAKQLLGVRYVSDAESTVWV